MPAPIGVVEDMLRSGQDTVEEISAITSWPAKNILAKVDQMNLKIDPNGKPVPKPRMASGAVRPDLTPVPLQPRTPIPQSALAGQPAQCSHAGIVAWAKAHPKAAVRTKGERFDALMQELVHLRRELEAEDRERVAREAARRTALAEVEDLKRRLREAEQRAGVTSSAKRPMTDAQLAAVRANAAKAREAKAARVGTSTS